LAKGVLFITIEDETEVANLILRPSAFEQQRRLVLSAGMLACRGRVQREGEMVHVIARQLEELSLLLASVEGTSRRLVAGTQRGCCDGTSRRRRSARPGGLRRQFGGGYLHP
jgi:error-prone DNA polymerase